VVAVVAACRLAGGYQQERKNKLLLHTRSSKLRQQATASSLYTQLHTTSCASTHQRCSNCTISTTCMLSPALQQQEQQQAHLWVVLGLLWQRRVG